MTWTELDWHALDRLREKFLHGGAAAGPYWDSPEDLANYDLTYGERIGWKWDHVLRELRLRGWRPKSREVFDWGCGSGVAGRRVIDYFGSENFDSLIVWDHSPLATDYAAEAARERFPNLRVSEATSGYLRSDSPVGLLVISHVLNELPPEALAALRTVIARAEAMIWVEPGTHTISRQLGRMRDELRGQFRQDDIILTNSGGTTSVSSAARTEAGPPKMTPCRFRIVAPCTHELGCPMFAEGNERHWCHFFAPPPSEIFADSNWVKFGQRAGIDLRSLPYAFVAMEKTVAADCDRRPEGYDAPAVAAVYDRRPEGNDAAIGGHRPPLQGDWSRVIGRVEHFKPYARWLNCDAAGLHELELPKRVDPALFKQLERTKMPLVYRWRREEKKVLAGEAIGESS